MCVCLSETSGAFASRKKNQPAEMPAGFFSFAVRRWATALACAVRIGQPIFYLEQI